MTQIGHENQTTSEATDRELYRALIDRAATGNPLDGDPGKLTAVAERLWITGAQVESDIRTALAAVEESA